MSILLIVLGLAMWFGFGLAAWAATVAYFKGEFPTVWRWRDDPHELRTFSLAAVLFFLGPMGFIVPALLSKRFKHGFLFWA